MQMTDLQKHLADDRDKLVDISTIWRGLRRAGWSLKCVSYLLPAMSLLISEQLTKAARERNWFKRAQYLAEVSQYLPHELVFIDESSFDRRTSNRRRAWSPRGTRIVMRVHFLRGQR